MRVLSCTKTGQSISLVHQIATSGEGEVWRTDREGYLAKIYHDPRPEKIRKLEVMIAHPPRDPNDQVHHISFAWPQSLLRDTVGNYVGFLMPTIANSVDLLNVYHPQRRRKVLPGFNWLYLHTTAMNVASIIWAIHEAGYVLGDIKPQNILVTNQALPSIIDTDSFQVRDPQTRELFRCPVGSDGFTPRELMGQDLAAIEQTEIHDRFRLAVIIYLLLFGEHPFKGKWTGTGDSPDPNDLVRRGFWPYAPQSLIQPSLLTIPLKIVHPTIQQYFLRCFNEGHTKPSLRPTAREWFQALKVTAADLKVCRKVKRHYFSQSYNKCYWCERRAKLGVDIFPSAADLAQSRWNRNLQKVKTQLKATGTQAAKGIPATIRKPVAQALRSSSPSPSQLNISPLPSGSVLSIDYRAWLRLGGIMVGIGGLFALLTLLSQSKMDSNDMGLTLAGILLCLGLVPLCFIWMKVLKKYTP